MSRSKRSKTDSRTPSPPLSNALNDKIENALETKNSSSSSSSGNVSPTVTIKKECDKDLLENDTKNLNDNLLNKNSSQNSESIRMKIETKKPIAKVEPLDPNEFVKDSCETDNADFATTNVKTGNEKRTLVVKHLNFNENSNNISEEKVNYEHDNQKASTSSPIKDDYERDFSSPGESTFFLTILAIKFLIYLSW